jgi:hypothetical protein
LPAFLPATVYIRRCGHSIFPGSRWLPSSAQHQDHRDRVFEDSLTSLSLPLLTRRITLKDARCHPFFNFRKEPCYAVRSDLDPTREQSALL